MARLILIVRGKSEKGTDPPLSSEGRVALRCITPKLEKLWVEYENKPKIVLVGTGLRHSQTAEALGLVPTIYSPVWGGPEIKSGDTITFASGKKIAPPYYEGFETFVLFKAYFETKLKDPEDRIIILEPYILESIDIHRPGCGDVYRFMLNGTERVIVGIQ